MSQHLPGGNNPLLQQWHLLMTGYGYNFYSKINQARSDDQLVRQKASSSLTGAASRLVELESQFQKKYIPAASRDNPFPPAGALATLREIREMRDSIVNLDASIRGMRVPGQDRIWQRFRDEQTTLTQLVQFDYLLISTTEALYQNLHDLTADRLQDENTREAIAQHIRSLQDTV